jgi:hypothetical protein
MGLLDVIRSGVKIADKVTKPLQATVSYERCTSTNADGYGAKSYAAAVPLRAIVDWKQKPVRTQAGTLTVTRATVMLLDVAAVVVATAGAGIGDDDRLTLPDGTTGPILDLGGFLDAGTGQPVATEVMLG